MLTVPPLTCADLPVMLHTATSPGERPLSRVRARETLAMYCNDSVYDKRWQQMLPACPCWKVCPSDDDRSSQVAE
jgi:hypothetical protein